MGAKRKICVVTGSRADYGLLYWIIRDLQSAPDVELQLVVTGQHLAPEFGRTEHVIESDGFPITDRVQMLLSSDTPRAIAKSVGLGVIGFADVYARLAPDIVLLLGDRFEIFAAAQAAMIGNVPIAHIAGGDTTEGAFDEAMRHAITKMAHLHFVTNELSAKRVRQLGEDPASVFSVGSPGLDNIRRLPLLNRADLETALGAKLLECNLLVTFHPVTLERDYGAEQVVQLLAALESVPRTAGVFVTLPNADTGGREIGQQLTQWAQTRPNAHTFISLGQLRYLSLMSHVDVVVGNSSSGLYEAPSFGVPTVDIGDRQRGRLAATSVIHCDPQRDAICRAIEKAFALDCSGTRNPYGDGYGSERIVAKLRGITDPFALLKKRFHMFGTP